MSTEWVMVLFGGIAGAYTIINLIVDNKVMKNRINELNEENARLREYAKNSKP